MLSSSEWRLEHCRPFMVQLGLSGAEGGAGGHGGVTQEPPEGTLSVLVRPSISVLGKKLIYFNTRLLQS